MATLRSALLLVAAGLLLSLLRRDKLGSVIAFAGLILLVYGVISACLPDSSDGKGPPIF